MDRLSTLRVRRAQLGEEARESSSQIADLAKIMNPGPETRTKKSGLEAQTAKILDDIDAVDREIAEEKTQADRADTARAVSVAAGTNPVADGRGRGGAVVTRSDPEYRPDRPDTSFFRDAMSAQLFNDPMAQMRLQRSTMANIEEMRSSGVHSRATTTTSFAGLVVPQYLVDEYALALRSGRPTANVVHRLPLPEQGMSLIIPRSTTGASAASQATENTAVSSTDEVWANLTVPVVTIAGQQQVSRQSIERGTPGMDQIVFADLVKAYNAELDRQVILGSGASGQMLGIYNTAGITTASAYSAAVTATTFYLKTAGLIASLAATGTAIQPNTWVMAPRRWAWLISQVDTTGRPLVVPTGAGPMNSLGIEQYPGGYSGDGGDSNGRPVGMLHGLPVITDANVQLSIGTGPEDIVYLMDASQALLWEDNGGVPRQFRFDQTLGNQLTVELVLYNYAAFTAGRYPGAFGVAGGNAGTIGFGQIAPSF